MLFSFKKSSVTQYFILKQYKVYECKEVYRLIVPKLLTLFHLYTLHLICEQLNFN